MNSDAGSQLQDRRLPNAQKFAHISDAEFEHSYIQQGRSGRKTAKHFGMSPAAARMRCSRLGLEPDPRPKSVGKDLKQIQLDPAYEARRALQAIRERNEADFELYANRTICRECGEFMSCLNATGEHSHLRKHFPECGTNKERAMAYQKRYPGAPLQSPAANSGYRQLRKRWPARNELTGYLKKLASEYVTADELRGRRTDLRERPGEDFWVCLNCGRKIFSDPYVHLAADGDSVDSYRSKWGPVRISTAAKRAQGLKCSENQRERDKKKLAEAERILHTIEKPKGRRGRQRGQRDRGTRLRLRLFAALVDVQGKTEREAAPLLYPRDHNRDNAYKNIRTLRWRYKESIEKEKQSLASLSESQLELEIDRLVREIRTPVG